MAQFGFVRLSKLLLDGLAAPELPLAPGLHHSMQTLFNFLLRLILLVAGLVFAASLLVVLALGATFWALRYGWARLTGRPIDPLVFRIDPRAGFGRVYRGRWSSAGTARQGAPAAEPARPQRRELGDITDVEVKQPRA